MTSPLEAYMVHILDHLTTKKRQAEFRLKPRPVSPLDFVLEGRVATLEGIIATIERDLNYLRGEFKVED